MPKKTPKTKPTATQKPTAPSETNAQNSELDPQVHPSGARIENMKEEVDRAKGERALDGDPTSR